MRILYLTYDGLTDPLGSSQILPYVLGLQQKGHQFTIVSFEKPGWKNNSKELEELMESRGIKWIPLKYHKYPPVFSTLYDLKTLRKAVRKETELEGYHAVHCRSYITSIVGLEMKVDRGLKFIFDMRGYWADERIEGNIWDIRNPLFRTIYKYFKKKEKEFLMESDYVVSLTNTSAAYLSTTHSIDHIEVIPCCVDMKLFDREAVLVPQVEAKYIGYLGSLGTWYMTREMIEFFSVFITIAPEYKLLIVTKDDSRYLVKLLEEFDISEDQYIITSASRTGVPGELVKMDALLSFIKPVFSKTASSPTKVGEALSMDIPVVVNKGIGDLDQVVSNHQLGILIEEFSREEYLAKSKELLRLIQSDFRGRVWVENNLSLQIGIDRYNKVYENLLTPS